jgi:hypothetical protein
MTNYAYKVTLTVLGPFLTAAPVPAGFGFDKSFHRDFRGRPAIPSSHIKGKLRMSMEEIGEAIEPDLMISVKELFGNQIKSGSYEPERGRLKISDFIVLENAPGPDEIGNKAGMKKRTRTAIDPASGTAAEHQLRTFEDRFSSGKEITCLGEISFHAADPADAQKIANLVRIGFAWLPNLGSEKGVGFGRLKTVQVLLQSQADPATTVGVCGGKHGRLHLRITPLEPIAVGGVQKPRTYYAEAERAISGGAIKGALAAGLNRAFGQTESRELTQQNADDYRDYEKLVEHFSLIRVTHAFPTFAGNKRPVRLPLSTVDVDGMQYDAALSEENTPMRGERSPLYFIDWKEPQDYIGAAFPEEVSLTHTEIDDQSRRSRHGHLFTETYLSPLDDKGEPVEWVSNVDFSNVPEEVREETACQFSTSVKLFLDGLGRENHRVKVISRAGYAEAAASSKDLIQDGLALVTLQSDALMLDPVKVSKLRPGQDLLKLYAEYWDEISGSSVQLVDFFAHQSFKGGYLYHRYLGALERTRNPNHYRPYYLTNAGSLFKLEVKNEAKARKCLTGWFQMGLDLPKWAEAEYNQFGDAIWKACPFVRENGYGEIAVNLEKHWADQI